MWNTWFKCGKIPQNAGGLAGMQTVMRPQINYALLPLYIMFPFIPVSISHGYIFPCSRIYSLNCILYINVYCTYVPLLSFTPVPTFHCPYNKCLRYITMSIITNVPKLAITAESYIRSWRKPPEMPEVCRMERNIRDTVFVLPSCKATLNYSYQSNL